ncbi:DNA translocase FtsK [Martelella sp. AD-3]|uniref:FtsK/SpoIIIE family DNA translocase n=1 Tax=Martelella sp. AD-3 TaxID=686597 RepID=UPI000465B945|nr:DNA translocase FtsK [Martelella sp. AD-3]AMM83515.1 cell division protein FtsK [Martelella sp. AD-3]
MAARAERYGEKSSGEFSFTGFVRRYVAALFGFALFVALCMAIAALATWNVDDPSGLHATGRLPTNILGYPGADFADIMMQSFGLASVFALLPVLSWALALMAGRPIHRKPSRLFAWFGAGLVTAAVLGCFPAPPTWPLPNGLGGVAGDLILRFPALFLGQYPAGVAAMIVGAIFAVPALFLQLYAAGLIVRQPPVVVEKPALRQTDHDPGAPSVADLSEERDGFFSLAPLIGHMAHSWYITRARLNRLFARKRVDEEDDLFDEPYDFNEDSFERLDEEERPSYQRRGEPSLVDPEARRERGYAPIDPPPFDYDGANGGFDPGYDEDDDDDYLPDGVLSADFDMPAARRTGAEGRDRQAESSTAVAREASRAPVVAAPAPPPRPASAETARRPSRAGHHHVGHFELPSHSLLAEPKGLARDKALSKDVLEDNARTLEKVLEDFGVKGEIIHVRPGPVVTLYELEPAPGIKSSRVIGLADDIARSMAAISARVAVIPGRNAIGIELPNPHRETVFLREIIASRDFESSKAKLAMALGKTIGGESVTVDLTKMPHLLIAGTTGSGKSVAVNTMILSLLYRLTPDECRLIMIDPKMLELSVYDGIPHLLSPVVTDPKKAVVALKWTVREMEERYKNMAKLGVRNIDGFNSRVRQAAEKGETLSRTVQTGFDRETGEAIYETEEFDLEPMPYIVVIIDEMADLMMVAGKDIEGAVQRLAQMARAAGIHVIMATQRPSVDVITGTIKANFPTRISFQVTSKIDSRTILGEQGAEQLLGQGDMLHMAGGGRIQRVHGPFVSDPEVEEIVAYLKTQGTPDYLDAITADDDDDMIDSDGGSTSNLSKSDDPYDQAVAIVLRDGKASTSYVQRRLGIGYNRAASLIERMEDEGVIGPANHAGKREILVPTERDIIEGSN